MNAAHAIAFARERLKQHHGEIVGSDSGNKPQYCVFLLDTAEKTKDDVLKNHLIGYVNGYLWSQDFATIAELRNALVG